MPRSHKSHPKDRCSCGAPPSARATAASHQLNGDHGGCHGRPSDFPEELRDLPNRWTLFRRSDKVPIDMNGGLRRGQWYGQADCFGEVLMVQKGRHEWGVGFTFSTAREEWGIDLDKCLNPETGELTPWGREIVDDADSYTEISPNKCGLHVLGRGAKPDCFAACKTNGLMDYLGGTKGVIECYDHGRYFTVTGDVFEGRNELMIGSGVLEEIHARYFAKAEDTTGPFERTESSQTMTDKEIISKATTAKNGPKFALLFSGAPYPDRLSEDDLALASVLAFWTQDHGQIERIMRQSVRERDKWDTARNGTTWLRERIAKAIDLTQDVYGGSAASRVNRSSTEPDAKRPRILVCVDNTHEIVVRAEAALMDASDLDPLYQRGSQLVRILRTDAPVELRKGTELPAHLPVIQNVEPSYLCKSLFERAAEFYRINKEGDEVPAACPPAVVTTYQQSAGHWNLRKLRAIVQAPCLRADGTVLQETGYDEASQLVFDPAGVDFPQIADEPSRDDAIAAIEVLLEPVKYFPFRCPWDQSVWLAALLTPFVRPSLSSAPMILFNAPVAGSGKGKLASLVAIVASGTSPATMTYVDNTDEQRKRILALLMQGTPIVNIDNIDEPMRGAALCSVLTESVYDDRLLGVSKIVRVPTTTTWLGTGNNIVIVGDLVRRALFCQLDPEVERPDELEFPFDPVAMARANRPRLVAAALTVLRAHVFAGRPQGGISPFGSFEQWSEIVRASLVWAGYEDPVLGRQAVREADTQVEQFRGFARLWHAMFGEKPMTIRAAIEAANRHYEHGEEGKAFGILLEEMTGEADDLKRRRKIGNMIDTWKGRVIGGLRFVKAGMVHGGVNTWKTEST